MFDRSRGTAGACAEISGGFTNLNSDLKYQRLQQKNSVDRICFKKGNTLYDWAYVVNTDFNGTFTLNPQSNRHNEGIYTESKSDIPYELKTKPKEKFRKSVMLWGGISYQGLFHKQSPIFVDEWLELIRPKGGDSRKKMYFTGARYAQFIRTIIAQKANEELDDLRYVIFQDDQDRKP
ncbi:unnamed protein product [Rotaria sordida]|uniref:Uncharacterized protein n=1 Tax=Rotaria sordida TaxID=392033 RepID=A0A818RAV0_9BILA|nr:unnamed protein product [Rotaria sordida]